jgi:hypothetical protein
MAVAMLWLCIDQQDSIESHYDKNNCIQCFQQARDTLSKEKQVEFSKCKQILWQLSSAVTGEGAREHYDMQHYYGNITGMSNLLTDKHETFASHFSSSKVSTATE